MTMQRLLPLANVSVGQWLAPHGQKVAGSILGLVPVCVDFACSPCVCVSVCKFVWGRFQGDKFFFKPHIFESTLEKKKKKIAARSRLQKKTTSLLRGAGFRAVTSVFQKKGWFQLLHKARQGHLFLETVWPTASVPAASENLQRPNQLTRSPTPADPPPVQEFISSK